MDSLPHADGEGRSPEFMGSENYHEPIECLSVETKDLHRAITSLREELDAVDWYQQRAEACHDDELRAILLHNRNEEIEHASMVLEWIRRKSPVFAENLATYLHTSGPITEIEGNASDHSATKGQSDGSLGVGSLKPRR
ncbi:MAG: ferritin-like domain-containing protein [Polyangiaceae bacterium]